MPRVHWKDVGHGRTYFAGVETDPQPLIDDPVFHCGVDFLVFYYFAKGAGKLTVGNSTFKVNPRDLVAIPPGEVHRFLPKPKTNLKCHFVMFPAAEWSLFEKVAESSAALPKFDIQKARRGIPPNAAKQCEEAFERAYHRLRQGSYRFELCRFLCDVLPLFETPSVPETQASLAPRWLMEACEACQHRDLLLKGLPAFLGLCGRSHRHVARTMQRTMNVSPAEYLSKARVQKAIALLCETDRSTSEIATILGFSNVSYFFRVFKQHMGVTPGQYRRSPTGWHTHKTKHPS